MQKIFWISKKGEKLDVDKMTYNHLRNVLKLVIKNNPILQISKNHKIDVGAVNNRFINDDELLSMEQEFDKIA